MTTHPGRELCDIFVARFLEQDPVQRVRIADLLETAEKHANWQFGRRGKRIFCAALRGRFGDDVVSRQDGDLVAAVRFTEAFPAAQAWSLPRFNSVMNWPGLAEEPEPIDEDPQPPSLVERVQCLEQQVSALCDQSARYFRALKYSHIVYQVQGKAFFKACDLLQELREVAVDLCSVNSPMETNFSRLLEKDWEP